jgi:hypothetical protein
MPDTTAPALLVSFACGLADAEPLALALREACPGPIHWREERVLGHDYGDADTGELVEGLLRRAVLDLIAPADQLDRLVETARSARCRAPVRWHAVPVHSRGRIA